MGYELAKVSNKQIETPASTIEQKILEEEVVLQKQFEIRDVSENVMETLEVEGATKILQPNIEIIKIQSLEAVKQANLEMDKNTITESQYFKFREFTEEEKQAFMEQVSHLSESAIQSIRVDLEGNYYLKCINEDLAGNFHEITGVKYIEKIITVDGLEITVIVPEFPWVFECEIPEEMWKLGDRKIFKECTEQLRDYLETHSEMKSQFNNQQLEQIMKGEPYIKGYSWHHNEVPGKMQLVETKIHAPSSHTGGNHIWCGGIRQGGVVNA